MNQLTVSELIYLYLDGEATPLQQEVLFSHLSHDEELRQEFTDALQMSKTFRREKSSSKPPLYLSSRVFADAGIPYHGVDVATVSAAAGASWFSFRRLVLPVSAMVFGVLATYAAFTYRSFMADMTPPAAPSIASADARPADGSGAPAPAHQSGSASFTSRESREKTSVVHGANLDIPDARDRRAATETRVAGTAADASADDAHDGDQAFTVADDTDAVRSGSPAAVRLSVAPYASSRELSMVRRAESSVPVFIGTASSAFTLQADRVLRADMFGGSSGRASASDPSLALFWNADDQWSLGLSYRRDSYRFSDVTGQGLVVEDPRFTIVNAEAQWLSREPVVMGAKLFTRAAVGVANLSGAVFGSGGFSVGLQIPVSIITIQPGIALDGVLVNSRSGVPMHTRISFVTGIGVNL